MKLLKLKDSSLSTRILTDPVTVTTTEHVFALQCAAEQKVPFIMKEKFGVISIGYDTFIKKVFYINHIPSYFGMKKFLNSSEEFIAMLDDDSAALFKAYVDGMVMGDIPALLRDLANEIEEISTDNSHYNRVPLTTICDQLEVVLNELTRTTNVQAKWTIKDGKRSEWESIKAVNNTDDDSAAAIRYAERWATEMEKVLFPVLTEDEIEEVVNEIANETSHIANTEDITVFQDAYATAILIDVWAYGDALEKWDNRKLNDTRGNNPTITGNIY